MIATLIAGVSEVSLTIRNIIANVYNHTMFNGGTSSPMEIVGYIDLGDNQQVNANRPTFNLLTTFQLYREGKIRRILIPREYLSGQTRLRQFLMQGGISIEDIWITRRLNWTMFEDDNLNRIAEPYLQASYLPYLEFHIADQCNLNCKACEHYAALVKEQHFPDLKRFTADITELKRYIDDIGVIRILGGEPLLNPEVNEYVKLCRRLYPQSTVYIVTNALLLMSMPQSFFDTMKNANAIIHISFYPPLQDKMGDISNFLKEKGVRYLITSVMNEFTVKQTLKRQENVDEIFSDCFQALCNNLYEGKIASCFLPFTTKYFNAYFDKHLPEDGAIDLYDKTLTTEKLKRKLMTPFERCRYCTAPVAIKWDFAKRPSVLSDWVNDAV